MSEPIGDRVEIDRLRSQLQRAFDGEAWHGTPVLDVLAEVSAAEAAARPIPGAHTIGEIVNHIAAWLSIVGTRVAGLPMAAITDDIDWPPPGQWSDAAWQSARERLKVNYLELAAAIAQLDDAALERDVQGKLRRYTVYEDLHGVIQHSLYHLGQIVMLVAALRGAVPDASPAAPIPSP